MPETPSTMPHFPIPIRRYNDIAAIRLSTRSALPGDHIPEPPRPQYDTMKAYQRLERAGTIASLESLQRNVRPLFAYPRKDFETPRKKKVLSEEDTKPLVSSSLNDTSDLLDSIFSSSPRRRKPFSSSPRTSLDFSSSLPYAPGPEVWKSSPPMRSSVRRKYDRSSPPDAMLPTSSDLPYYPIQEVWPSSPPQHVPDRYSRPVRHRASSPSLHYFPSSPPELTLHSAPRKTAAQRATLSDPRQYSGSRPWDYESRCRQQRDSQRLSPSPVMRYTTILEDVSEDTSFMTSNMNEDVPLLSRRSRLSLRVERAVGRILHR